MPGSDEDEPTEAELLEREEALRRMNAAIDGELAGVVSDVDSMLERRRREDERFAALDVSPVASPSAAPSPVVGAEAASRIKKAQSKQLKERLEEAVEAEREASRGRAAAEELASKAEAEVKALRREVAALRTSVDKETKLRTEAQADLAAAKRELAAVSRAARESGRQAQQIGNEHRASDVRLQRALEEGEKHKAALQRARQDVRESTNEARKDRDKLQGQIRKLDRQKAELLAAFRKQLKLIDVLKRQKLHMEAARLLAFTEDDFMKVVSWGDAKPTPPPRSKQATAPETPPPPTTDD